MLTIINYGIGNLRSIYNMLKKIGVESVITSQPDEIENATKFILPGIGAFDHCMQQFNASGLRAIVEKKINNGIPVLGVCVGCQMLMQKSEEGTEPGLGWLQGNVIKFRSDKMPADYKVPHMGWSNITFNGDLPLYKNMQSPRFYFVHSYHIDATGNNFVTATAEYGYSFVASVGKDHIQGVQFHPEKSHKFGMELYANFVNNF